MLEDFKSEVKCSCNEDMSISGSVEIYINTGRVVNDHSAGFGYLEVPSRMQNHGVGTALMMKVIEVMIALKDFYSIDELKVSGWLSQSDCQNGNWKTSVPLYERVGHIAGVKTSFEIVDKDIEVDSAKEFLNEAGTSDGHIMYRL